MLTGILAISLPRHTKSLTFCAIEMGTPTIQTPKATMEVIMSRSIVGFFVAAVFRARENSKVIQNQKNDAEMKDGNPHIGFFVTTSA